MVVISIYYVISMHTEPTKANHVHMHVFENCGTLKERDLGDVVAVC